jgi:hypothetical protein
MTKLISMPTSPWFIDSTFTLNRAVGATSSPFSGKQRTQEFDFVGWEGTANLPPMNRTQAVEWQAFLLECIGTRNYFNFIDPDAKDPVGTYNGGYLAGEIRIDSSNSGGANVSSATLSFASSGSQITSTTDIFDGLVAGDYITIAGANNVPNNGTHKITTKTSDSVIVVNSTLTTENSTSGCSVKQNIKGSEALSLEASGNSNTGTIKKGDFLSIYSGAAALSPRVQLVMATSDATETSQSGSPNHYSVSIQPKLRADLADTHYVGFSSTYNQSRFRLTENAVTWSANQVSLYGISLAFAEVI